MHNGSRWNKSYFSGSGKLSGLMNNLIQALTIFSDGCKLFVKKTAVSSVLLPWMDGWIRTSVHGSDPSLEIIHWPPIPPRTLHRCDALGRVIPANNQSHSCKYSTGVNLTVLVCQWCNYNCQLRKAPLTTVFNLLIPRK